MFRLAVCPSFLKKLRISLFVTDIGKLEHDGVASPSAHTEESLGLILENIWYT